MNGLPRLALPFVLLVSAEALALDVDMDPVPRFPLRKGDTMTFLIQVSGASAACKGAVAWPGLPEGLSAEPARQDFNLAAGESKQLVFTIKCSAWGGEDTVRPSVTVTGDEIVNFPERLKTTLVRTAKMLDKKPLDADGLLAYYSCGDASEKEYHHFDRSVGNKRFWEEGIWYHDGGVKGRAVFGMNGMPYPRHRWSKFAYETLNNVYYRRGTISFWMRRGQRRVEIPYSGRFKGDPTETWKIGPTAMRGYQGEGLVGYIWSPQSIYSRWYLKSKDRRKWGPFQPSSDSFISLRRYKAVKGVTDGFLEATYLAMRGKKYTVQAPYRWDRAWRHVALLWDVDKARLEIYLDGKKASGPVMLNGKPSTDKVWHAAPWHVATFCNAAMSICCVSAEGGRGATDRDEYYVYDHALSEEKIRKNMAASMGKVVTPVLAPAAGSFHESMTVTIRSAWANPAHRYTIDGSEPTADSPVIDKPIELTVSTTVKVRSFLDGFEPSDVATAKYEFLGPDKAPPQVTSVASVNSPGTVLVGFNEPVEKASAETSASYLVDGKVVQAAKLEPDGQSVRLTVRALTAGEHKLTVKGVRDRSKAGNVAESACTFTARDLPGLIGYWNFDVLTGVTVKDLSPHRVDGFGWDDLGPGIQRCEGAVGRGVQLDGVNDLVDVTKYVDPLRQKVDPESPHNVDVGTIAIWFKGDSDKVGYKKHLVAKTYAYEIWATNGFLQHTKTVRIIDDKWHHLAVTYDRGAKTYYLDGKKVHSEKGRFLKHQSMGVGLGVGGGGYGQPMYFAGALDEFMLFDRQLSAEEIKALVESAGR